MANEDQGSSDFDADALFASLADEPDEAGSDSEKPEAVPPDGTPRESVAPTGRADGRDDNGRFVAKVADADSTGTPAKTGTPALEADAPSATAQAAPTAEGALPEHEAPPAEPGPTTPLAWRSGDRDWEFPGAVVSEHGVFVPPEGLDLLKMALGKATTLDETREALRRDKTQLKQRQELFAAETGPVMNELNGFFAMAKLLREAPDEDAQQSVFLKMAQWALDFAEKEPALRERMAFEREKREFALQRELQQPDPETQQARLQQDLLGLVDEQIAAAKRYPEFGVLTDQDYMALRQWVADDPAQFLVRDAQGNPAFHADRFAALVRREGQRANQLHKARTENQQALEAAKKIMAENAKRLNGGKPVVQTAGSPAKHTAPATERKAPQTKSEFEAELRREFEAALMD